MHLNEVSKYLGKLTRTGQIAPLPREGDGDVYFAATGAAGDAAVTNERNLKS
jgi:hypothetical protein